MVREHPSLAQFRKNMKQGREDRHWSQADLAKYLSDKGIGKIYPTTVAKIENSERAVRIDEAAAIADVFDTTVDALMGRSVDEDAELDYVLRGITSAAERSALQVREIVKAIERARDDLGALDDFAGRGVLQGDIRRSLLKLTAAQGALTTMARFERGTTAAPTMEELGR